MNKERHFAGQIHHFLRQDPPDLQQDDTAGRTARELWWTNQEFSPVDITPPYLSKLMYHLRDVQ
jgi:hypothetical protein